MRLGFVIMARGISSESTVGRAWVPDAKEVQYTTICWQGDGHFILGSERRYCIGRFKVVIITNLEQKQKSA